MLDLRDEIRDYYDSVIIRTDPYHPPAAPPPSPEELRARRGVLVALAVAVLVLVSVGFVPLLLRLQTPVTEEPATTTTALTTSTTSPPDAAPTTTTPPERVVAVPTGSPLLEPFLSRPACGNHASLAAWATERMAPFADLGDWGPTGMEEATSEVPLLADDAITCFDAVRFGGGGVAWAGFDASGDLVARAVVRPADQNITEYVDYDALRAAGGEYHQDWIGTGQALTGWVVDGGIEASVRTEAGTGGHLIMDIPGYVLEADPEFGLAAAPLLAALSMNTVELGPGTSTAPSELPPGFIQCTASIRMNPVPDLEAVGQPVDGLVTTYCNADGETFRWIDWWAKYHVEDPDPVLPEGRTVDIGAGLSYRAWQAAAGGETRWYAALHVPWIGEWLIVESPRGMTLDELTELLASSPRLNPDLLDPQTGTNDLRDVHDVEWVTGLAAALGGTDLEVEERRFGREGPQDPNRPVLVTFVHGRLKPLVGELFIALHDESGFPGLFWDAPPGSPIEYTTVNGVTLLTTIGEEGWAYNATARCGGLDVHLRLDSRGPISETPPVVFTGDPVRDLATELIELMGC